MIGEILSTAKDLHKSLEEELNPTIDAIKRFQKQQDDLYRKHSQFQQDLINICEKQISDCDKVTNYLTRASFYRIELNM